MSRVKVLFLCTGNTARSQMAEAFLHEHEGDRFEVHSAGLDPSVIHPCTVRAMEEIGIDLGGQYSKSLSVYMGKVDFGYLITVCGGAEARCPSPFPGMGRRLHWALDDPTAATGTDKEKMEEFRQVRDQIERRVRAWLAEQGTCG